MKWDLEDIDKYHSIKLMQGDYKSAHQAFMEQESAKKHGTEK